MNAILDWAIDRFPRLRPNPRPDYPAATLRRVARVLAERPSSQHVRIVRSYLRYRLLSRLMYRLTMHLPRCARFVARRIPIAGREHIERANGHDGAIIIAPAHFGSLFFQSLIVMHLLRGRRLYMMHDRRFVDARRDEAFLRRCGIVPVGADARGLRMLVRALDEGPSAAIVLPFDSPVGNRHAVDFLATRIPVSTGLGFLADIGRCPVIPWFWHIEHGRPSIDIGAPLEVDPALPAAERRIAIVEELYAILERRVARFPAQWHLEFIREAVVRTRGVPARVR